MSLKPPKHSEQKWPNKRSERKRSISLDYNLIVTEGTQTEPQYFDALKANINRKQRNRIQLEIRGLGDNTVNLFYAAKKMVEKKKALTDTAMSGWCTTVMTFQVKALTWFKHYAIRRMRKAKPNTMPYGQMNVSSCGFCFILAICTQIYTAANTILSFRNFLARKENIKRTAPIFLRYCFRTLTMQ